MIGAIHIDGGHIDGGSILLTGLAELLPHRHRGAVARDPHTPRPDPGVEEHACE